LQSTSLQLNSVTGIASGAALLIRNNSSHGGDDGAVTGVNQRPSTAAGGARPAVLLSRDHRTPLLPNSMHGSSLKYRIANESHRSP
jgi:hypothetical protein